MSNSWTCKKCGSKFEIVAVFVRDEFFSLWRCIQCRDFRDGYFYFEPSRIDEGMRERVTLLDESDLTSKKREELESFVASLETHNLTDGWNKWRWTNPLG